MTRYRGDVGIVETHAVDEQRPFAEQSELLEKCDRRARAALHRDSTLFPTIRKISGAVNDDLALFPALSDVHRQRKILRSGVASARRIQFVGHGVGRVRRNAELAEI